MKIGLIRETKTPADKRVPLTPLQCAEVIDKFKGTEVFVQTSSTRIFSDEEYRQQNISVVEDVSHCDILMGVKEVKKSALVPNKKYLFFSHTIKKQPHNQGLLQEIVRKKIQLIDYETLTDKSGQRIIGFGRWAGIVGCYNGFRAYGLKRNLFAMKPANQCRDRKELDEELAKIKLPDKLKVVATGSGRVGGGAREVFLTLGIREITPDDFCSKEYNEPVFTQLEVDDYYTRADGSAYDRNQFFKDGKGHVSTFPRYLRHADLYVACHFWHASAPFIVTAADLKAKENRTAVIADISCDIGGPVACTIRASTIADPFYGYDPMTGNETDFLAPNSIGVMAVDNLPCELPRDASESFGRSLIDKVFPALLGNDPDKIIDRASETTLDGKLSSHFKYLEDYLNARV